MERSDATRSGIIRAAMKPLRIATGDDPAKLFAAVHAGGYRSPERSLADSLEEENSRIAMPDDRDRDIDEVRRDEGSRGRQG